MGGNQFVPCIGCTARLASAYALLLAVFTRLKGKPGDLIAHPEIGKGPRTVLNQTAGHTVRQIRGDTEINLPLEPARSAGFAGEPYPLEGLTHLLQGQGLQVLGQ